MVLVLWMTGISGYAQSISARKVSCAFSETRLDEVIRHLSQEAGVSFIYSSNKTDLSKVVSLRVADRALEETLALIGNQVDVEFRIQGRYVIIKPSERKRSGYMGAAGKVPVKARDNSDVMAYYPAGGPTVDRSWLPTFVDRGLPEAFELPFPQASITPVSKPEPASVSVKIPRAGWYFSLGPVFTDHSSAVEFQAGIKSLYLVFTPTWVSSGQFRGAYGLGTSIGLGSKLTLTPIYLLGQSNSSQSTRWNNGQGTTELKLAERTTHHQVKILLQYAVAPSLLVKFGPVINQSTATYDWYQTTSFLERRAVISSGPEPVSIGGAEGNVVGVDYVLSSRPSFLSEQRVRKAWIGWEASIAFKINFSDFQ